MRSAASRDPTRSHRCQRSRNGAAQRGQRQCTTRHAYDQDPQRARLPRRTKSSGARSCRNCRA
eukprot:5757250-Alexandrium_andersonii.AAC.1